MFIHTVSEDFDPRKHFDSVPLYQELLFRRWQERWGRQVVALVGDDGDGKAQVFVQCVEYVLPVVGSMWVAASGPIGSFDSGKSEAAFYRELRSLCAELAPKTIAVRVQKKPMYDLARTVRAERMSGIFVQPFLEEVVSLEADIEAVVSRFSGGTRRTVRRYEQGEIEGVRFHIEKTDFTKHFNDVYTLFEQLARKKKFGIHPRAYYEALFQELDAHPESGTLILGYVDDEEKPVSFALVIHTASEAYHLYSASSDAGYEHALPALTQYIALRDAKKRGAKRYNLGGTASASPRSSSDLSTFKKKFGGERIEHPHSRDIIISCWRYTVFRLLRLPGVFTMRRWLVRFYTAVQVELDKE